MLLINLNPQIEAEVLFWSKSLKQEGDGCWRWNASCFAHGYGQHKVNKKNWQAHRYAYFITYGDIPKGLCVCHSCDVKKCINPQHLWLGTSKENIEDMIAKGRQSPATGNKHGTYTKPDSISRGIKHRSQTSPNSIHRGESHSSAKLTQIQVDEIRKKYKAGGIPQSKLATEYKISRASVGNIILNKSWRKQFDNGVSPNTKPLIKGDGKGENNGGSKLTQLQVGEIITLAATKEITQRAIAKQYGVCENTVSRIITGKLWKNIFNHNKNEKGNNGRHV